ncbi:hypothetical protein TNCV_981601 [Trichonephila clavipes]|nr:hypothetical protein TNCV_981601 [Trichonephila clavipes]
MLTVDDAGAGRPLMRSGCLQAPGTLAACPVCLGRCQFGLSITSDLLLTKTWSSLGTKAESALSPKTYQTSPPRNLSYEDGGLTPLAIN